MNVSTVSPSPASPTEGVVPCETDVTDVAIHSVTLLISLCGLTGNGTVFCLLRRKQIKSEIFCMAVTDFLFLLFTAPCALLFLLEDMSCSPLVPLEYLSIVFLLSRLSYCWALLRVTAASFVTAIENLCELLFHCKHPLCQLLVVVVSFLLFFFINVFPIAKWMCPSHEQQQCQAALISIFTVILLLFVAPTVIPSTIEFIKAKCGPQQQQLKRRYIAVCLIVLFTLPLTLWNFLEQLSYFPVSSQVVLLLACIYSSIKPFICFLLGRCWRPRSVGSLRESLRRVFEEQEGNTAQSNDVTMDTVL